MQLQVSRLNNALLYLTRCSFLRPTRTKCTLASQTWQCPDVYDSVLQTPAYLSLQTLLDSGIPFQTHYNCRHGSASGILLL